MNIQTCALTSQGPRAYNEDTFCMQNIGKGRLLVGVFDGHGGKAAAELCSAMAPEIAKTLLRSNPDIHVVLRDLYKQLDELTQQHGHIQQGCCAAIMIVTKQRIWFSNCGDAMIVCKTKDGTAWQSEDHKVENEKSRLQALGGMITYWDGCARLFGGLNIGRSIGDHAQKQYVISDPYITSVKTSDVHWVTLASDGLWDVYGHEQYGHELEEKYIETGSLKLALTDMVRRAYEKGSTDNITIVHCDFA